MLRDGLDVADTVRFPEAVFGPVDNGKNPARCSAIVAAVGKVQTRYPPRLDALSNISCGSGRHRVGLNDAGYQVYPGNYHGFLQQLAPDSTSYGAWRVGPEDELFGRYGRSIMAMGTEMEFKVVGNVFDAHVGDVHARVVFFRTKSSAASTLADFVVSYSITAADSTAATCVSKTISSTKDAEEHWVEVQFTIAIGGGGGRFGGGGCGSGGGADVTIAQPGPEADRIVFNLLEISKDDFDFRLSPWQEDGVIAGSR